LKENVETALDGFVTVQNFSVESRGGVKITTGLGTGQPVVDVRPRVQRAVAAMKRLNLKGLRVVVYGTNKDGKRKTQETAV